MKISRGVRGWWVVVSVMAAISIYPVTSSPGAKTRTAVDQVGRTVIFPDHPRRVVSLAPSITEIVYAVDRGSRLKGATIYSDYPTSARDLPRVGSYVHLDIEKIVALKPDLCIAVKDGNPKETADRISDFGIPVYAVNPVDLDSVIKTVGLIGSLLNAEARAAEVINDMEARIQRVENRVATTPLRPRVFFQIGISPIVSVGGDTFLHGLIHRAGGENLAGQLISYPRFTKEQVLGLNPDVIIITSMARSEIFDRVKQEWQTWYQVPAVSNNQIHVVDSNLFDRPTPRMVDGLEMLVRLIHPELF